MTTLERLARIVAPEWFGPAPEAASNYPGQHLRYQEAAREKVRALLQELREPDEAMMEAGKAARGPLVAGNPPGVVCNAVFRAMIDAILSDTPTPAEG